MVPERARRSTNAFGGAWYPNAISDRRLSKSKSAVIWKGRCCGLFRRGPGRRRPVTIKAGLPTAYGACILFHIQEERYDLVFMEQDK